MQPFLATDDTWILSPGLSYQNLTQNFGPRRNQRDIDRGTCRRRVKSQAKWKIDRKRVRQTGLRHDWKGTSQSITGRLFGKSVVSSHYSSPRCPNRLPGASRFVSRRHQVLQRSEFESHDSAQSGFKFQNLWSFTSLLFFLQLYYTVLRCR